MKGWTHVGGPISSLTCTNHRKASSHWPPASTHARKPRVYARMVSHRGSERGHTQHMGKRTCYVRPSPHLQLAAAPRSLASGACTGRYAKRPSVPAAARAPPVSISCVCRKSSQPVWTQARRLSESAARAVGCLDALQPESAA